VSEPLLVRNGADVRLDVDREGFSKHTFFNVYHEMFLQVVSDVRGIGDFRELSYDEVEYFYDTLRPSLREATKPK